MIGDLTLQSQAAKPAIGQIEMNLFTQPPFGADAEAIADDEHPDHQFRIDRGPANRAIECLQLLPSIAQIDEAVDPAQQMIVRNVILKAEVIEQLLRC